jgi:hypothetical protein
MPQPQGKRPTTTRHGTLTMYRYCKCEECRTAMKRYLKKWRAKRREWKMVLPEVKYG